MQGQGSSSPPAQLRVGDTFGFSRTFTEGDVSLFCGLTGDYNPFHIDDTFASEGRFGARVLPGLLTGSMMTHIGGMLATLASEMHFEFLAPVFIGDTITCTVTIDEVDDRGVVKARAEFSNASEERVLVAGFTGKPMRPRLTPRASSPG